MAQKTILCAVGEGLLSSSLQTFSSSSPSFFLSLIAYFAIGTWHNYTQYGATGLDAIPHRDMWQDLPYVVSDLFKGESQCSIACEGDGMGSRCSKRTLGSFRVMSFGGFEY